MTRNKKYRLNRLFRDFSLLALLILYSAASLRVDSLHQFFHAEEIVELHSLEHESDPCHKSIYHQQSEKGCHHQSHLSSNTKCPLCEHKVSSDELCFILEKDQTINYSTSSEILVKENLSSPSIFLSSGRAPPQYV